jgi:hypothetical protein
MKLTLALLFVATIGFSATISGVASAQPECSDRCEAQRVAAYEACRDAPDCNSKAWAIYDKCRQYCDLPGSPGRRDRKPAPK